MNARIEARDQFDSTEVIRYECDLCGGTVERDYREGYTRLSWFQNGESYCTDCERTAEALPNVAELIKRLVENRLTKATPPRGRREPQKLEIDAAQRSLTVRDRNGKLIGMYELLPHPREALVKEQEESDRRLHAAVNEHFGVR